MLLRAYGYVAFDPLRKHSGQEAVERHLPAQALQVYALLARASL